MRKYKDNGKRAIIHNSPIFPRIKSSTASHGDVLYNAAANIAGVNPNNTLTNRNIPVKAIINGSKNNNLSVATIPMPVRKISDPTQKANGA
jgi:hypothetical protein